MTPYLVELQRIEGTNLELGTSYVTITLLADCPRGAADALEGTKKVLVPIVSVLARGSEWPSEDDWARLLPAWFVGACGPEMSRAAVEAWLEKWRDLPREQQIAEEERHPWALGDWLYCFSEGPDERQWRWLGADPIGRDRLRVTLEVEGLPVAYGALRWLLRVAGASRIREV
jgi:hypothetical protein